MGYTSSAIKRHISRMPEGRLFHTSELLGYGRRGTVDQSLRRLSLKGYIIRVARALWVKTVSFQPAITPLPSAVEIARAKAGAFKKQICSSVKQIAHDSFEFLCSGRNSSFDSYHGRIYLRQTSQRKVSLGDGVVGTAMLQLWNAGPGMLGSCWDALSGFRRSQWQEIRKLTDVLPQWLSAALRLPRREPGRSG